MPPRNESYPNQEGADMKTQESDETEQIGVK